MPRNRSPECRLLTGADRMAANAANGRQAPQNARYCGCM